MASHSSRAAARSLNDVLFSTIREWLSLNYPRFIVYELALTVCDPMTGCKRCIMLPLLPLEIKEQPAIDPAATHAPDFRSVRWYGAPHQFTLGQSLVVKLLWESWERGEAGVSGAYLLENVGDDIQTQHISDLFKGSTAWQTMIGAAGKGVYRLVVPESPT